MTRNLQSRNTQRGSAMLVTLILVAALLAGVAVLVALQLSSTKSTELTRTGLAALHCAEAGLAVSHREVANNKSSVITQLSSLPYTGPSGALSWQSQPTFLTTYYATGSPYNLSDIDGDGTAGDFVVYIIDDDDESSTTQAWNTDINSRVWLVSRCTKYPDSPKEVRELVEFGQSPTQYEWQEGRSNGANNANPIL